MTLIRHMRHRTRPCALCSFISKGAPHLVSIKAKGEAMYTTFHNISLCSTLRNQLAIERLAMVNYHPPLLVWLLCCPCLVGIVRLSATDYTNRICDRMLRKQLKFSECTKHSKGPPPCCKDKSRSPGRFSCHYIQQWHRIRDCSFEAL